MAFYIEHHKAHGSSKHSAIIVYINLIVKVTERLVSLLIPSKNSYSCKKRARPSKAD